MKHKFTKNLGRITENLELGFEGKWIYVHYSKGSEEKTACLLKNENKTDKEYLDHYFAENPLSVEMEKEVMKFIEKEKTRDDTHWNEFSAFLMKTLSLNMVFGISIALCVFGGYKLGSFLDERSSLYPTCTIIGTFLGIILGGVTVFFLIQKYFILPSKQKKENEQMQIENENTLEPNHPIIDVDIDDVRKAVRQFSDKLPKGVYRTILVQEDNSIDFTQIVHILGGIPAKNFYMSKETYDLFEEDEKHIPAEMDMVQKAVDQYVKENREYPMLQYDPHRRVNYYQLLQDKYLKKTPDTQFYITDLDGLVTHIKPQKKNSSLH
ncbi:AtpZ/AtpI family protein [Bacillus sp. JJ1764]|uniref:AtpZ/AtpI family protein n=1 Tax=Bacillus sp. JJ1764 TaxID=3122964 RepID=UPI002FFF5E52